jgi:hypothetical protein
MHSKSIWDKKGAHHYHDTAGSGELPREKQELVKKFVFIFPCLQMSKDVAFLKADGY